MVSKLFRILLPVGVMLTLGILLTGCIYTGVAYPDRRVVVKSEPSVSLEASAPSVEAEAAPDVNVEEGPAVEADVEEQPIYVDQAHPGVVQDYYYYPGTEVYFDPFGHSWFWLEGGIWRTGLVLPGRYHIDVHSRVVFRTDARRPYLVHERMHRRWVEHHGHYTHRAEYRPHRGGYDGHGRDNRRDNVRHSVNDRHVDNNRNGSRTRVNSTAKHSDYDRRGDNNRNGGRLKNGGKNGADYSGKAGANHGGKTVANHGRNLENGGKTVANHGNKLENGGNAGANHGGKAVADHRTKLENGGRAGANHGGKNEADHGRKLENGGKAGADHGGKNEADHGRKLEKGGKTGADHGGKTVADRGDKKGDKKRDRNADHQ